DGERAAVGAVESDAGGAASVEEEALAGRSAREHASATGEQDRDAVALLRAGDPLDERTVQPDGHGHAADEPAAGENAHRAHEVGAADRRAGEPSSADPHGGARNGTDERGQRDPVATEHRSA